MNVYLTKSRRVRHERPHFSPQYGAQDDADSAESVLRARSEKVEFTQMARCRPWRKHGIDEHTASAVHVATGIAQKAALAAIAK